MMKLLSIVVFAVAVTTVFSQSMPAARGLPNSQCTNNKQCKTENSFCHINQPCYQGVCMCNEGYSLYQNFTEDLGQCVEDKKMGETCGWMNGGCVGNLECDLGTSPTIYSTGTCKCPYGTTADGDMWCKGEVALHGMCGTSTSSHWACAVYHNYYKDDMDADSNYLPVRCLYNSLDADYRCSCNTNYDESSDNSTCERKTFAAINGDCSVNTCDPEVTGMFCDTSLTPDTCKCVANQSPRSYSAKDGAMRQRCAHASAVFDIEEGHNCDVTNNDASKHMYCEWPLQCGSCPEDGGYGTMLCRSGAATMALNLTVLALALVFTKYF